MVKTIGVLGGMGPEATAIFYRHLIKLTPAEKDQDHIPVIIYSQPKIPDRTEFLVEGGESPLPMLQNVAKSLEKAGADLISIPCNTAHVFWKEIQECVEIPVLNIVRESAARIRKDHHQGSKVAILSTAGTLKTELYQTALKAVKLKPIVPSLRIQRIIQDTIHRIKAGDTGSETQDLLSKGVEKSLKNGADTVILGCTELGVVFKSNEKQKEIYDSLKILAEKTVESALPFQGIETVSPPIDPT